MNALAPVYRWMRDRPWVIAFLWIIPALLLPTVPIDETRYLSIAWEMRRSGDAIGLTLNGQPYMDKSPLLFWLINVAWSMLGVSTASARFVCIAFASASVAVVSTIARKLRHDDPVVAGWILLPFVVFGAFTPIAMFDVPLLFFVALGFLGLLHWVHGKVLHGVALFLIAGIFGLLAKGPVYLLHLVGPLALMRWWHTGPIERPWRLAGGVALCLVVACVPLGAWAIVSASRMQGVPLLESLTHQSVGRVAHSFAHQRNVVWYVPWLIPFLLPWALLIRWKRLRVCLREAVSTAVGRFGVAASLPALFLFSLISGKQIHYLLPLLPGVALLLTAMVRPAFSLFAYSRVSWLLVAVALAWAWPVANAIIGMRGNTTWYIAAWVSAGLLTVGASVSRGMVVSDDYVALRKASLASLMALMATVLLVGVHLKAHMDPRELADAVKDFQRRGIAVAAVDDEPGMATYLARLPRPLPRITDEVAWTSAHPQGLALVHASRGEPPSFVVSPITLADGWEGLVPAVNLREVHP